MYGGDGVSFVIDTMNPGGDDCDELPSHKQVRRHPFDRSISCGDRVASCARASELRHFVRRRLVS